MDLYDVSVLLAPDAYPFSVPELRLLTILQQIPFVIPFDTRVQVCLELSSRMTIMNVCFG